MKKLIIYDILPLNYFAIVDNDAFSKPKFFDESSRANVLRKRKLFIKFRQEIKYLKEKAHYLLEAKQRLTA